MDSLTLPGLGPPKIIKPSKARVTLRPYQTECVRAILSQLKTHRSTLAILATGLGKGAIFCEIARLAKRPVLVVVDGDVLVDNAVSSLEEYTDDEIGVEQGASKATAEKIVVASLDSITNDDRLNRLTEYGFGIIIIDEAHLATSAGYTKILTALEDAKVLGLTATPKRRDRKALPFESKAFEYHLIDGIKDGWLCPFVFKHPKIKSVDFSNVNHRGGDLSLAEARAIMGSEESLHGIVGATMEIVGDRPTIMFANSIQNARALAGLFNRYADGNVSEFVDSKDMRSRNERRAIMAGYIRGDYQYFVNVGVAGLGWNAPLTAAIGMAAPTLSEVKYMQQLGRGSRGGWRCPVGKKRECLVLDYVGNTGRHSIIRPAYVLAGKFGIEVQKIAGLMQEEHPDRDPEEIVFMSRQEFEEKQAKEAERRKFIVAKVNYEVTPIDPFKIIKVSNPSQYSNDTSGPMSPVQIARFEKWRMDIPAKCTKKMAQALIRKEHSRLVKGYASYRMCKWGLGYGYNFSRTPRQRAKDLFLAVKANNWNALPRAAAAKILLSNQPGEDG